MNLISRKLTKVVCSSLYHWRAAKLPTQKWVISQQIRLYTATVSGNIEGREPGAEASAQPLDVTAEIELARPETIENDGEPANWVNLTGFVDQPVQFQSSSEGIWAGTIISQRSSLKSSNFWIPIIFEGNLARIAAHHVKKDDRIRISGKLFIDSPPPNVTYPHSSVQIVVQDLNFEEATISLPEEEEEEEEEEFSTKEQPSRSKKVNVMDEETSNAWKDLLENPKGWFDYRGTKASGLVKPRHPDFKGKDGGLSLWLCSAPDWVLPKLKGLEFHVFVPKGKLKQLKGEESWKDLVQNTDKWFDNRSTKTNPKAPDFKHKDTGEALWMTDSPPWVLSELPPLKKNQEQPLMANNTASQAISKPHKGEEFWKDLVQNPGKWWDNRLKKTNPKAPDFKHKETGEALWMTGSPPWVQSELQLVKNNQDGPIIANWPNTVSQLISKPHNKEEFWKDLIQNPGKWWDNRSGKRNAKAPDFKHKETGEVLWMTGSPSWVHSELPPLTNHQEEPFMAKTVSQPILKQNKKEELWRDLVQNPGKWWDNRSKKMNAKSPDFKHKETGEALWLNGSPSWVLSELPPQMKSQETPTTAYVLQPF